MILFIYFSLCPSIKKNGSHIEPFSLQLFALNLEDFLTVIITASLANTMIHNEFAALRALRHAGELQFPSAGTSLISASL